MGVGGWVESIIRLISADAEAKAMLGLAELGKNSQASQENFVMLCLAHVPRYL